MKRTYRRPDVSGYPGPGERNAYRCKKCGEAIVVIHAYAGVTPMFLACRATEGCGGMSVSMGYPSATRIDALGIAPTFAWSLPTDREFALLDLAMRDHVTSGGLVLVPLSDGAA